MFHYSGKGYWSKSQPLKITNQKDLHISTQGNKTSLKASMSRDCRLHLIYSYALNDDDDDDNYDDDDDQHDDDDDDDDDEDDNNDDNDTRTKVNR